jgi:hypothetical protein
MPFISGLFDFLRGLQFVPIAQHSRPITWIELYIHYRAHGLHKPIQDSPNPAKANPPLNKQVERFKLAVHRIAER